MTIAPTQATSGQLDAAQQKQQMRDIAEAKAFSYFAAAAARMRYAGLAGGALLLWIVSKKATAAALMTWGGIYVTSVVILLLIAYSVVREGPDMKRHEVRFKFGAALDGAAWALMLYFFLNLSDEHNAWLGIFFAAGAAINAISCGHVPRVFRYFIISLGVVSSISIALQDGPAKSIERIISLWVYLGIVAYIAKQYSDDALNSIYLRIANADLATRLESALAAANSASSTDALTGMPNRRALDTILERHVADAPRHQFCLLLIDIDHFRQINEQHGHIAGDAVLQSLVRCISATLRPLDICSRLGGEEFAVIFPATELSLAELVAERIRQSVEAQPLTQQPLIQATISLGVACYEHNEGSASILNRADTALYRAKTTGRNRVCVAEPSFSMI
jgi:diguanylate cyclase (GGDEF)-like protein